MNIPCICPPKATGEVRHPDGDTIELRERLDFRSVLATRNAMAVLYADDPDASTAEVLATLTESYLLLGISSWTIVDDKGKPVAATHAAIREYLFNHDEAALAVADEADELYRERIIAPLVLAAQKSSPPTPTKDSTSATTGPVSKTPKPSKRSSITTTRMDGIGTTTPSLAGGSNSSRSYR